MGTETSPLIEHLEIYFGKIESGWNPSEWTDPAIQVVEFRHGKIPDVTIVSTLGLSSFALRSTVSMKQIRQELFLMVKNGQLDPKLPAILDQIAREKVRTDTPLLRGEVIQKEGLLLEAGQFAALYVTLPVYYPNSFWSFHDEDMGDVAFCWILPIKDEERRYIDKNGWAAFEELLDKANFDLFDLNRPSLL
jgi:hypothetical protein